MEPISDPSMIPPPLRSPRAISKEVALNANVPRDIDTGIGREGPEISGMIAAGAAAVALMLLLILGWIGAGGSSEDASPIGGQTGEPITEAVLAGENTKGSSIVNGQEEQTNEAVKPETSVDEKDVIAAESEVEPEKESENSSNGNRNTKQNEATLSLVPNRQSSVAGSSQGSPSVGGPGNTGGLDLASTKGMNPFVGEGKPAASTVFVIDVSGSMSVSDKLPRVINALTRAIDQLSQEQKFCVLLFDQEYYSAPFAIGMIPGVNRNKQMIKQWLSQPPGGGGTNPMAAMSVAIDYRPERIVLLSDGEFDPTCSATITMMNKQFGKSARIDCVGLMENVLVLRDIAALNNGTYYQAW
jgi:Mg-chelatase subunit ChlD